ncbi:hypothetical protein NKT77_01820 [Moraxella sp. FZLJ2107]|uniref:hypothetical protein n=1 Tax=unclassified Moraxella TaxID=2685852 RepID=UPI0020C934E7|nr:MULTISPECIES: hypothetical protein [unclassified Moraxella]UTO05418.1 hypothetical protein NKT77_01820 [Moraxella sp. FZLJ2107]UTO22153.1 hypothetical protein NKU06_10120 [Moraxella sp. FZLJ2109]
MNAQTSPNEQKQAIIQMKKEGCDLYYKNPKFFDATQSGYGFSFIRPTVPFSEIYDTNIIILDETGQYAFHWQGFTDLFLVDEGGELNILYFDGSLPKRKFGVVNDYWDRELAYQELYNKANYSTDEVEKAEAQKQIDKINQEKNRHLYDQYAELLKRVKLYGWKPYVSFGERAGGPTDENGNYYTFAHPRVIAKDAWEIERAQQLALMNGDNLADEISVSLDGYYIDSFDKWQRYVNVREDNNPGIYVQFYKDNLLLTLNVDNITPSIEIKTNTAHYFYLYDEETRIKKWKEYLATDIPKWQAERKEAEDILRAKGYTIDESYVDAPLPKEFLEWQQAKQSNSK